MISIYKASAGSGKTYSLTRRYIMLLLTEKDGNGKRRLVARGTRGRHRTILAVTFTNKATDEMKRRIVHELAVLAGMERGWTKRSPYLDDMVGELGCTEEDIADRARTALRDLLHDFGRFNVSTIDSFFQTVLRTFAREAELPGNYEVDLDEDTAVRLGVNETLRSINRADLDNDPSEMRRLENWLEMLMHDLVKQGKNFNFFNRGSDVHQTLVRFVKTISDETYLQHREEIDRYLADPGRLRALAGELRKLIDSFDLQLRQCGAEALPLLDMAKNVGPAIRKAANGELPKEISPSLAACAGNPIECVKKDYVGEIAPGQLDTLSCAAQAIIASYNMAPVLRDIINHLYILGLIGRINERIAQFRNETSTLLLSDTNALLRRIIGDDTTPFIYERTGQWLNHFLIDEFQDTSRLQWLNLKPLVEESLAFDNDNLVIGDEKQCIYRFRNSDPSLLHNLHGEFGPRASIDGDTIEGNTNWRSAADVVKFNNTLFSALARTCDPSSPMAQIYAGATQQIASKNRNLPGYVLLEPFDPEAAGAPERQLSGFAHTAAHIRRQLDAGYRPADIAVLFRKGSEAAAFIEYILALPDSAPGYPRLKVMSDESLYVSRSQAVRTVISVLRIMASKGYALQKGHLTDRESAALINRYERHVAVGETPSQALMAALDETVNAQGAGSAEKPVAAPVPASSSLTSIVQRIMADSLTERQLREEAVYLTALLDMVMEQAGRGVTDPAAFLKYWDDKGRNRAVAAADDPEALRVMTIHKSKGLEWACVHIPFADGKKPSKGVRWFATGGLDFISPDLLPPLLPVTVSERLACSPFAAQYEQLVSEDAIDDANVAYVAFTRAVRELVVGYDPKGGAGLSSFLRPLLDAAATAGFADTLRASLPEGIADPYADIGRDPSGRIEVGAPTAPAAEEEKRRTLLDPEGTMVMPPFAPQSSPALYGRLQLDEDSEPLLPTSGGPKLRARVMAKLLRRLGSGSAGAGAVKRAVRALVEQGDVEPSESADVEQLLRERVAGPATAQWFEGTRRVMAGRTLYPGRGRTVVADRIVWLPDGQINVIQYERPDDAGGAAATARFIGRTLIYAGHRRVSAFTWDLVTGRVSAVPLSK